MSKNSTLFGIAFACGVFALIYGVSIDNAFQRQSAPAAHLALGAAAGSLFSSGVAYVSRVSGRPALSSGATFISFFIAASTIAAGCQPAWAWSPSFGEFAHFLIWVGFAAMAFLRRDVLLISLQLATLLTVFVRLSTGSALGGFLTLTLPFGVLACLWLSRDAVRPGRQAFVRALAGCTAYLPAITTPLLHMEAGTLMFAPAALALAYTLIPCALVYGELRYRIPDPQRRATAMIIVSRVIVVLAALGLLPLTFIFGLAVIWP